MQIILPLILLSLLLTLVFGPQWWVRRVLEQHAEQRDDLPGTGGELARHLLNRFGLEDVQVEVTEKGDHYDPEARCVRLLGTHHDGKSLTDIVIATHEVGHALQHASGYTWLGWRSSLARVATVAQKLGVGIMLGIPVVTTIARVPSAGTIMFLLGLSSLGLAAVIHLITLPVELDASFKRALPILETGDYIPREDLPAARKILRAAALTYLASSLMSLLNLWRWIAILRR